MAKRSLTLSITSGSGDLVLRSILQEFYDNPAVRISKTEVTVGDLTLYGTGLKVDGDGKITDGEFTSFDFDDGALVMSGTWSKSFTAKKLQNRASKNDPSTSEYSDLKKALKYLAPGGGEMGTMSTENEQEDEGRTPWTWTGSNEDDVFWMRTTGHTLDGAAQSASYDALEVIGQAILRIDNGRAKIVGKDGYTTFTGFEYFGTQDEDDIVYGGTIDATVTTDKGKDAFYGGSGNETVRLGKGKDEAWGGDGDDFIDGEEGNDTLYGDAGEDELQGNTGDDTLYGGADDDYIRGAHDNDDLYGGEGNDDLGGGRGEDWLDGGEGDDTYIGGREYDIFYVEVYSGSTDSDTITDFNDWGAIDKLRVSVEDAGITPVIANSGADLTLTFGTHLITVEGMQLDDFTDHMLFRFDLPEGRWVGAYQSEQNRGTDDDDVLYGGEKIRGERGADEIHFRDDIKNAKGGKGADAFYIDGAIDSASDTVKVKDFQTQDTFYFTSGAFTLARAENGNLVFEATTGADVELTGTSDFDTTDVTYFTL